MPEFAVRDSVRTAYEVHGRGPALLLMHGAEASRQMFGALVPLLAERFTVVAYDQRDCGDTESPPHAATLADLADDAHSLVAGLGLERAHVFGSSFGGRVAQALAVRHPASVDRLVLGSTWPLPRSLAELNPDGVATIRALRARLPDSAEALAEVFFPAAFLDERPDLRRFFASVRPATDRSQRRSAAVESTIDADPSMIRSRTLLLTGSLDRIVPPAVTLAMAPQLTQCEQIVLEGVGHATALQAPAQVAAALARFLDVPGHRRSEGPSP